MQHKFNQLIDPDSKYDFVQLRTKFFFFSGFLMFFSVVLIAIRGLNFGIDFSGGTEIQVEFSAKVPKEKLVQEQVNKDLEKVFPKYEAQRFGSEGRGFLFKFADVSSLTEAEQKALKASIEKAFPALKGTGSLLKSLRFPPDSGNKAELRFAAQLATPDDKKDDKAPKPTTQATTKPAVDQIALLKSIFEAQKLSSVQIEASTSSGEGFEYVATFSGLSGKISESLVKVYGADQFKVERVESVGPRVGKKLRNDGILAILMSLFFILVYVAIRFDFRYAPGAVIALFHDVLITTGVFSLLQLPFDLSIIAALLTIVGYSLNDTIVVFDRIRENWQKSQLDFGEVMNRSINETLSRTLLTSGTTFLAVFPIFIYGGSNIQWFAFAMMLGILIGTYSSIAVAAPIVLYADRYLSKQERSEEEEQIRKREERRRRRMGVTP